MGLRRNKRDRGSSGQSVVEFALLLPVLLALAGATSDFARLYQQDISLSAATRDAAEYIATNTDKSITSANAGSTAANLLNAQLAGLGSFSSVSTLTCTSPQVSVTYSSSSSATGATYQYPLGTAVVQACVPFKTLFSYPFVPSGQLTINTSANYAVLQNRAN